MPAKQLGTAVPEFITEGAETPPVHVDELDGVRGFAILLVLAAHFSPDVVLPNRAMEWSRKILAGGWVGVDLFFVLSGFLITGILLRTRGKPHALKLFFARRALRIFPLYFAVLSIVFVLLPFVIGASGLKLTAELHEFLRNQAWVWFTCTNIGMYVTPAHTIPAPHFWSLAVEEHYYLVWPFVVWWLNRRQLKALCIGVICFSLATRMAGIALHQNVYFFVLTPCRIDALAIGSYLAVFAADRPLSDLYRGALAVGGASAAALAANFFSAHGLWAWSPWMQGPGLTLVGLLFGSSLVIVLSADSASLVRGCCRASLPRFFGKYSYGIYVVHGLLTIPMDWLVPLTAVIRVTGSVYVAALSIVLVKTLISVGAARVSWVVLERPALRLKPVLNSMSPRQAGESGVREFVTRDAYEVSG